MAKRYNEIKYEALGFVEAMMAIMIVGIASVVLMQIAANTLQNVMQNEAMDNATQYAVEGAEIVQEIAKRDVLTDDVVFPRVTDCFAFDITEVEEGSMGVYTFMTNEDTGEFVTFEKENRDSYKDTAVLDAQEDEFFRLICLEYSSQQTEGLFVMAEIVVGQRRSSGEISRGNLIKDYEYRSVIKFVQRENLDD